MDRRDLLKMSPLALGSTIGHLGFAEPFRSPAEAGASASAFFDVRTFGAAGDGKTVDSAAIHRAIDAAARAGGGTVVLPAGQYLCFSLHLKSHVQLYLSPGCTLLAADSPKPGETTGYNGGTYDAAEPNAPWEPYQDYGHNHWHNSLLWAEDAHDFGISGPGRIWGRGLSHGGAPGDHRGDYPYFSAEQPGVANKAIALKNCHNVTLRDFQVLKGGHFALLATGVDNLTLDNLLVDTDRDGFDLDCCRNVRVSNCTVNSPWDDAICPKSSYALGYPRSTDNVTIANCYVTGSYVLGSVLDGTWKPFPEGAHVPRNGRIKCGTESNGGFRNITITNCVCEGSKGIALESSDGALIEDVVISNVTLRDTADVALFLRLNGRNRGPKETMRAGCLRRVFINNLVSHNAAASTASVFSGVPDNLIEDVSLNHCFFEHTGLPTHMRVNWGGETRPMPDWHSLQVPELEGAYPEPLQFGPTPSSAFFLRHMRGLSMAHVEVAPLAPDPRPAFWLEDVHRADFFAVTAPMQGNFALRNVTDLRVFWSRAAKDITLAQAENQIL